MRLEPRFFTPIGTLRHAARLGFLTQDVRRAGTVMGFVGAAAALGAQPADLALVVIRRQSPADLHRQVVIVFQKDPAFADGLGRLYRARRRPIGFEGEQRWCAIPEPSFLADETFALLAARFPHLLLIEEQPAGTAPRIEVLASSGFRDLPQLKLAPLPGRAAAPARPAPRPPATVTPLPAAAARPAAIRLPQPAPARVLPLRPRRLKSTVALNERVERQVVDEFRRLLKAVSLYS
ncbi:hypothetical protein [Ferrovibrio sp.]|uniref:hypothetical protein n=1 Tax=Ferrovibrio sp. TaxID=1917215 RepID=UPI0035181FE4